MSTGTLYLIATPIGNLQDITERAVHLLRTCDVIACENLSLTRRLLHHLESNRPLLSYREANEKKQTITLIKKLQAGESIALVCDAGTPTLSDPGFRIVRACRWHNLPVVPIPGPCALLTALCASGLPTNGFLFTGFLPSKKIARQKFLEKYKDFPYTLIFYESCHRIERCTEDLIAIMGENRIICIARELTKKYETFIVRPAHELPNQLKEKRGEFVILIAPKSFTLHETQESRRH